MLHSSFTAAVYLQTPRLPNTVIHDAANAPHTSDGFLEDAETGSKYRENRSIAWGVIRFPKNNRFARASSLRADANDVAAPGVCGPFSKAAHTSHSCAAEPTADSTVVPAQSASVKVRLR